MPLLFYMYFSLLLLARLGAASAERHAQEYQAHSHGGQCEQCPEHPSLRSGHRENTRRGGRCRLRWRSRLGQHLNDRWARLDGSGGRGL